MKKVLLIVHELSRTGAPKAALDIFEKLQDTVEVKTIALSGGPLQERCRTLGELFIMSEMPYSHSLPKRVKRKLVVSKILRSLKEWGPDIIYVNSVAALPVVELLELPKLPVLLHVHELESMIDEYASSFTSLLKSWPSRYIAVSEPVRRLLLDKYQIPDEKIVVIHELVRDEDAAGAPKSRRINRNHRFVVGGCGYPSLRKGVGLWLEMASEAIDLLGQGNVHFKWIGMPNNSDGAQYRLEAKKLNIDNQVEFVPSTSDPYSHFEEFDVFAMTSWEDPCPIVVFEAMMLEKPVVCFAESGGAPEQIGNTGRIVTKFSPHLMAKEIADLAANSGLRCALGIAARERVLSNFVASVQVPKILREIERLSREQRHGVQNARELAAIGSS